MTSFPYILKSTDSIIVKAPAGSGKTELLVQKYLSLLAYSSDNPRQVLAITFTRKAAAEMRARIRLELQRDEEPVEKHKKQTYGIAQAVRRKAEEHGWNLDRLISQETVTTIDAFCRTLLALDPMKADFFTMPDIVEDEAAVKLYRQAVQASIKRLSTEKKDSEKRQALKELIYMHNNDIRRLEDNFVRLLQQRAPLLPEVMQKDNDLAASIAVLCTALVKRIQDLAPANLLEEAFSLMRQAVDNWQQEPEPRKELSFHSPRENTRLQDLTLSEWQNLAGFLLTQQGTLRKRVNKGHGFPPKTTEKERMENLLAEFAAACQAQEKTETEKFLYYLQCSPSWSDHYTEGELRGARRTSVLFKEAAAELFTIFKMEGKCDYTEIMLAAVQIMKEENAPSLLAEWLGYQLRHILVDEFQDTSLGQLELLKALCRSWDASSSNSLFLVGDPMQSIYAFRQADVRIFNQLWETKRLGQVPLKRHTLTYNYRAQAELVDWCNKQFDDIFPPVADNLMDAVVHTPAQAVQQKANAGIRLVGTEKKEDGDDFGDLIEELKKVRAEAPTASIALLVPSRNHIKPLIPLLQEHNLAFNAAKMFACIENPHIVDLLSLTRALYDYADDTAWFACLRAPWCGLELADLLTIAENKEGRTIWQSLVAADSLPLSVEGLERTRHFVRLLSQSVTRARRSNWSDLVHHTWRNLGGRKFLETAQDENEVELFFALLQENTRGAELDLETLNNQLQEKGAVFEDKSPIQLMTVHSAKGLEFDFVFLPVIHKKRGRGIGSSPVLIADDFLLTEGIHLSLFATHSPIIEEKDEEPAYRMLGHLKKEKERQEYRRLFYVACTRAKHRLYLHYALDTSKKRKQGSDNDFLSFLFPLMEEELKEAAKISEEYTETPSRAQQLRRIPLARLSSPPPPPARQAHKELLLWTPPEERAQGTLIHRLIKRVTAMNIKQQELRQKKTRLSLMQKLRKDESVYRNQLAEMGVTGYARIIRESLHAMERMLHDERGTWLLSREGESEFPLMHKEHGMLRLDRMFVEKNICWIVDYKTTHKANASFSDEELHAFFRQLVGYAEAVQLFGCTNPLVLGIYCPQNGFWHEWNFTDSQEVNKR